MTYQLLVLTLAIISVILSILEKCESDKWSVYVLIFIHHFAQLYAFIVPLVYIREIPKLILLLIILVLIYMNFQNNFMISKKNSKENSCIISKYTNKECKQSAETQLMDFQYHIGLKKDTDRYNRLYNIYVLMYTIYVIYSSIKYNFHC